VKPWLEVDHVTVYHGDCINVMRELPADSVHAVVTDPPYGLEFMGKDWDAFRLDDPGTARHRGDNAGEHGEARKDNERGAFGRVAYGGGKRPTTFRCTGCGKRDQFRNEHPCDRHAKWKKEIIDPHAAPPSMLAFGEWSRQWCAEAYRVLKPGGHLLAFGGTRTWHRLAVAVEDAGFEVRDSIAWMHGGGMPKSHNLQGDWQGWGTAIKPAFEPIVVARKPLDGTVAESMDHYQTGALNINGTKIEERWPANVILDESQAAALNQQFEEMPARFFYCPKPNNHERPREGDNMHPTVKPLNLMRYLVRLVTAPGGTVLEPFAGSGTTLEACIIEGRNIIGIELTDEYLPLIRQRITKPIQPALL
jgi:DNA modification methylase